MQNDFVRERGRNLPDEWGSTEFCGLPGLKGETWGTRGACGEGYGSEGMMRRRNWSNSGVVKAVSP